MRLFRLLLAIVLIAGSAPLLAGPDMTDRPGFAVHPTDKTYAALVDDVLAAVRANGMGVVTQAGPTGAAAKRGITIPGNRVIGVFNNDFAVRILAISTAAMIEAPIRFYVTENADGTATLSYKIPSHVFAPYADEGSVGLVELAAQIDAVFARIAEAAVQ